jgi:AraC-like DNA-binding protein
MHAKLSGMLNLTARPRSPLLKPFVKSFHYHETDLPFSLERVMPNGHAHLMVNLAEDEFRTYDRAIPAKITRQSGAVLAGPHAQSVILDTRQMRWLAAIQFRAGGAAHFLNMPMSEACNQVVSLEDLWRSSGATVRERLIEAPAPQARFAVLEQLLLEHIQRNFDPAIECAVVALERGMPVSLLAQRLGLLPKTFVRRFTSKVGITPKRFARVRRLQRVMRSIRASAPVDWSELAARYGYADQSHLVHEFRELAGITPSAYKPHSPQRNNHVPIAAQ